MSDLKLFLLGSPYLERSGQTVEMDTRKALALLSYLAINRSGHNRDALAALFWPDYDESSARGAFRRTLSTLNKALGEGILEISRERIILTAGSGLWVDVWEFERLLAESQKPEQGRTQTADQTNLPALQKAVSLYRGDFLAGFSLRDSASFDDWQFFQSEALRQQFAGALEKLARGQGAGGSFAAALVTARQWVALDPLNEPAHRLLMQFYEWSGQHGAALRQYRECVRVLEQQLGVTPLDETTQLYQAILEQRLPAPLSRGKQTGVQPQALPVSSIPEPAANPPAAPTPVSASPAGYPMVGRENELKAIHHAYHKASQSGYVLVLQGEAGIGKTRLAQEFLAQVCSQGARCTSARCYEGENGLAFVPIIEAMRAAINQPQSAERLKQFPPEWLTEINRLQPGLTGLLLPDTFLPAQPASNQNAFSPSDQPGAQSRFVEAVSQGLVQLCQSEENQPPGVLFLDDMHWADSASLDLLLYLSRRLAGVKLLVLITWRDEQIPADHALRRLLAEARRGAYGAELTLRRLPIQAVQTLLAGSLPANSGQHMPGSTAEFARQLHQETEGLPFFLIEYLAVMNQRKDPPAASGQLPPSVRDLLHSRLHEVDETCLQLLAAASVLGRSFEFDLLRQVSGRSDLETVTGLERLLQLGLVQEQPASASSEELVYDFYHEKLRRLVYEETSLARRRLLHGRAAETLSTRLRLQRQHTALVAQHYQLAGQHLNAAQYYRQAGAAARAIYANHEAVGHFQNALACGWPQPAELHEEIGDLFSLSGEYQAALKSYETAAALCPPERLGWVEHRLGNVRRQRGEWELAECHYVSATQVLAKVAPNDSQASGELARVYADWSHSAYRRSRLDQAQSLAERALTLSANSSNQAALAQAHNMLGLLARSRRDFEQAILHLQNSLEITTRQNDPGGRAAALNNLAHVYADRRDIPKAIELTQTALALCQQQGDRHRAAALHNNLADLYHAASDSQNAMQHLKQAVTVFAEIGGQTGEPLPEIWMLAEW